MTVFLDDFEDDDETYVKGEHLDLSHMTEESLVSLQYQFDTISSLPSEEERIEAAKNLVRQMYGE